MKIVKAINALLYFIAIVMALFSLFLDVPVIQRIYWFFFGWASILLLATSIVELILRRKRQSGGGQSGDDSTIDNEHLP